MISMKKIAFAVILILFMGCATTYKAPSEISPFVSSQYTGSRESLITASQRVLLMEGYQVTHVDYSSGMIFTAPKDFHLTSQQANCGTNMGIDYLKDNRTSTKVSMNVLVDSKTITVKSNIQGEYKPGSVSQDITLTCVSTGVLERNILQNIKSTAGVN